MLHAVKHTECKIKQQNEFSRNIRRLSNTIFTFRKKEYAITPLLKTNLINTFVN